MPGHKRRSSKWRDLIDNEVVPLLRDYRRKGVKPSLRSLHYNLISRPELALPNTESTYKQLGKYIVEARKEGRISWDAISDNTRYVIGGYEFRSPDEYVDLGINYLRNSPQNYLNKIYRWHKQPKYVEVWIEKDAMSGVFESYLRPLHVRVAINKGYSSWTALYQNCQRLLEVQENNPSIEVHVLYFGDYDPSGNDMENQMHEAFRGFGLEGRYTKHSEIKFERISITLDQIERFNLPHQPADKETLDKLSRDTRTKKSIEDNGGELYAVELDALYALYRDEFKQIVIDSVNDRFDEEIYNELLEDPEYQEENIRSLVHNKTRELQGEFEP